MCLITTQKKPLIAKKDITVYKLLDPNYKSPYTYYQYKPGKLVKAKIKDSHEWCGFDSIDQAWLDEHYPTWFESARDHKPLKSLKCIGSGLHSAATEDRLYGTKAKGEMIVKCTIPKGSEYYKDATGLRVSNQLIVHPE